MDQRGEMSNSEDLEGAGPGGGADIAHWQQVTPRAGTRSSLVVTAIIAILVLLVPVVWAFGYLGALQGSSMDPSALFGLVTLGVFVAAGAALYLRAQFSRSA